MRIHCQSCRSSSQNRPSNTNHEFCSCLSLRSPTSFIWSRTSLTALEELLVMWKKMGFSRTQGASVRIIRRWARPRRSLQSEGTRSRWTLIMSLFLRGPGSSISYHLQEDMDSFPSRWMVSDAGPAFRTGILAPNITFLSSFRQST